jgi:hypothetical protein
MCLLMLPYPLSSGPWAQPVLLSTQTPPFLLWLGSNLAPSSCAGDKWQSHHSCSLFCVNYLHPLPSCSLGPARSPRTFLQCVRGPDLVETWGLPILTFQGVKGYFPNSPEHLPLPRAEAQNPCTVALAKLSQLLTSVL